MATDIVDGAVLMSNQSWTSLCGEKKGLGTLATVKKEFAWPDGTPKSGLLGSSASHRSGCTVLNSYKSRLFSLSFPNAKPQASLAFAPVFSSVADLVAPTAT